MVGCGKIGITIVLVNILVDIIRQIEYCEIHKPTRFYIIIVFIVVLGKTKLY